VRRDTVGSTKKKSYLYEPRKWNSDSFCRSFCTLKFRVLFSDIFIYFLYISLALYCSPKKLPPTKSKAGWQEFARSSQLVRCIALTME